MEIVAEDVGVLSVEVGFDDPHGPAHDGEPEFSFKAQIHAIILLFIHIIPAAHSEDICLTRGFSLQRCRYTDLPRTFLR